MQRGPRLNTICEDKVQPVSFCKLSHHVHVLLTEHPCGHVCTIFAAPPISHPSRSEYVFARFLHSGKIQRKLELGFSTQYRMPNLKQIRIVPASHLEWLFPSAIFTFIAGDTFLIPQGSSRVLTAGVIARESELQMGAAEIERAFSLNCRAISYGRTSKSFLSRIQI